MAVVKPVGHGHGAATPGPRSRLEAMNLYEYQNNAEAEPNWCLEVYLMCFVSSA